MKPNLGLCFHRESPAAAVVEQARAAEAAGYDEFWVIEDCFFTAGVSLAAAALTATERIGVGIGIMPAVARNPAVTAMEIATLAGLAPGRFHAGIGHGVQEWMAQMGVRPSSPLTTLEETLRAVRSLLRGRTVTTTGATLSLDEVALDAPPDPVPLVSAGVRGPKSLALSGRCADGTILAEFCSPAYLRWARDRIAEGSGPDATDHRITVFAAAAVAADGAEVTQAMTPVLAGVCQSPPLSLRMASFWEELAATAAASSWLEAIGEMPAAWWSEIAPIGTPDEAAHHLRSMAEAGADVVAVFPNPADPVNSARQFLDDVVPLLD